MSCFQIPTGASQERVTKILKWVLPPLTDFYNTRVGLLKPALSEMYRNPLISRGRGGNEKKNMLPVGGSSCVGGDVHGVSSGVGGGINEKSNEKSTNRRASVSELIWTNNFLGNQHSLDSENEMESLSSSGQSFISTGLEKSQAVPELSPEDYDDVNLEKIRQNARIAGICKLLVVGCCVCWCCESFLFSFFIFYIYFDVAGNDLHIFVREIATIKKKVDHMKERQEFTLDSWNSKVIFLPFPPLPSLIFDRAVSLIWIMKIFEKSLISPTRSLSLMTPPFPPPSLS